MLIELISNLAILVALSVVSGFVDARWKRGTRAGMLLQGVLFGGAATIGMLKPFVYAPGLVFDGRSVMISLAGLFFGPLSAAIACVPTIPLRLVQGGPGATMGVLVILCSALIGIGFHWRQRDNTGDVAAARLLYFGMLVHLAMLAMTAALPADLKWPVLKRIGLPVMLVYPLATVLIGKILSDQAARHHYLASLQASEERYRELVEHANSVILRMKPDGTITFFNEFAQRFFGFAPEEIVGRNVVGTIAPATDSSGGNLASVMREILSNPERFASWENENTRKDGSRCWLAWTNKGLFDEQGRCLSILSVGTDITERKRADTAMRRSLLEKEALLKEIHHRVKNNMQIVSSLLRLQSQKIENRDAKAALQDMQNRVKSMALIHEHLYRSENLAEVDLAAYLDNLCRQLFRAHVLRPAAVALHLNLPSVRLGIDRAIPCGLLVNELVSNAFKHGFPEGRQGEVRVELQAIPDGPGLRLRVADNGIGLPADFHLNRLSSLGLRLVPDLARQMGGTLTIGSGPGAVFDVAFTPEKAEG